MLALGGPIKLQISILNNDNEFYKVSYTKIKLKLQKKCTFIRYQICLVFLWYYYKIIGHSTHMFLIEIEPAGNIILRKDVT